MPSSGVKNPVFEPMYGNTHMHGRRHTPWRSIESHIAVRGCPMDWKYVVATTFIDIVQSMQFDTVRSCAAVASSDVFAESTKRQATILGNGGTVWMTLASTHRTVVIQNPSTKVSRTRAKFRAPQL